MSIKAIRNWRGAAVGLTALVLLLLVPLTALAYGAQASRNQKQVTNLSFVVGREGGNIRPFSVTIQPDGTVAVNGPVTVKRSGVHLSKDAMQALYKLAKAEKFFSLPGTINGPGFYPDTASLFVTVSTSSGSKTVKVHATKNTAFSQLYSLILAVAGACDGVNGSC
jgi:hypothetical protein